LTKSARRGSIDSRTSPRGRIRESPVPRIVLLVRSKITPLIIPLPTRTGSLGLSTIPPRLRISAIRRRFATPMASSIGPMPLILFTTCSRFSRRARSRASRTSSILVPGIGRTRFHTKERKIMSGTRNWTSCTGEVQRPVDFRVRVAGDDSTDSFLSVTPMRSIRPRPCRGMRTVSGYRRKSAVAITVTYLMSNSRSSDSATPKTAPHKENTLTWPNMPVNRMLGDIST